MNWVAISSPAKSWTVLSNQLYRFRSRVSCMQPQGPTQSIISRQTNFAHNIRGAAPGPTAGDRLTVHTDDIGPPAGRAGARELHSRPNVDTVEESCYSSLYEAQFRFVVFCTWRQQLHGQIPTQTWLLYKTKAHFNALSNGDSIGCSTKKNHVSTMA